MSKYVIAHDLGTSGNKATLFNEEGMLVASYVASYRTDYAAGNRAEQNPADWWKAIVETRKLIPFPVIWKLWNALCHMDSRKERPLYFYTGYAPNWFYVEMKREWDDEVVEMPFEDTRFYAPAGWDELLTQLYGDYMKLPPEEKQIPEHSDMEIKIYD